jgi:hypothetical protein
MSFVKRNLLWISMFTIAAVQVFFLFWLVNR